MTFNDNIHNISTMYIIFRIFLLFMSSIAHISILFHSVVVLYYFSFLIVKLFVVSFVVCMFCFNRSFFFSSVFGTCTAESSTLTFSIKTSKILKTTITKSNRLKNVYTHYTNFLQRRSYCVIKYMRTNFKYRVG